MYNIIYYLDSGRTYKVHLIKIVHLPMFFWNKYCIYVLFIGHQCMFNAKSDLP